MGVKDLWNVLTPFFERKPLSELHGKTVAIDLSCWVCEAQNIAEYQVQPRMYLRNLYFRTCYLILLDVNLVFVLEGKAPELKYQTIAARNVQQFKGAKPKTERTKTGKDRTRFNHTLKLCEEMLRLMGIACITGKGEAEATCAYLNEEGLVHGCISQDSDCFAYGAKVVYRNFSISQQGGFASSGGAVDVYNLQKVTDNIDFGRNKIIAMALLCGSDYNEGVHGVGKDSAAKLFDRFSDRDILNRLKTWRENGELFNEYERQLADKNRCTACGHAGKIQSHNKNGCIECCTKTGCDSTIYKEERLAIKNELNIRSKALLDAKFPDEDLMNEFLVKKDAITKIDVNWRQPDLIKFVKFTSKYLEWEEIYAFEKMFPVLTRWIVINQKKIAKEKNGTKAIVYPDYIKKIRNPKAIPSYEIIWVDRDNYLAGLIPEEQLINQDRVKLMSSIEPQEFINTAYPGLVEVYLESKIKVKKPSKRKKKIDELSEMLQNASITDPKPAKVVRKGNTKKGEEVIKKTKELAKKTEEVTKQVEDTKKIENFAKSTEEVTKKAEEVSKDLLELERSFDELNLDFKQTKRVGLDSYFRTAVKNSTKIATGSILCDNKTSGVFACSSMENLLDLSCFGDENDDLGNLSGIIDNITSKPPKYVVDNLKKLKGNVNIPNREIVDEDLDQLSTVTRNKESKCEFQESNMPESENMRRSSFFALNTEENDLFEKSMVRIDSSGSETEDYDVNDYKLNEENVSDSEDSFVTKYVPLAERLGIK